MERYIFHESSCGFKNVHSTQHALSKLQQRWQQELDCSGFGGIQILPHVLIVTKLEYYIIILKGNLVVLLIFQKQKSKIDSVSQFWWEIQREISHGSIFKLLTNF